MLRQTNSLSVENPCLTLAVCSRSLVLETIQKAGGVVLVGLGQWLNATKARDLVIHRTGVKGQWRLSQKI